MSSTELDARIRIYGPGDHKVVLFGMAHSIMEQLGVANRKVYTHPVLWTIWVALAAAMISFLNWYPDASHGWLGYLKPLPAFGAMAVPLLFAVDWFNRPYFETEVHDALRRIDVADVASYYSLSGTSAFWVVDLGGKVIGMLALDASKQAIISHLPVISTQDAARIGTLKMEEGKNSLRSTVAIIRHFWIDEQYRPTHIQDDLLLHATTHARNMGISHIRVRSSSLEGYKTQCLKKFGFTVANDPQSKPFGILRWRINMLEKSIGLKENQ